MGRGARGKLTEVAATNPVAVGRGARGKQTKVAATNPVAVGRGARGKQTSSHLDRSIEDLEMATEENNMDIEIAATNPVADMEIAATNPVAVGRGARVTRNLSRLDAVFVTNSPMSNHGIGVDEVF
jgi:hypothetical protein